MDDRQGFSTTPASNVVKFGTTAATAISAAATQIVAAVPAGLVPNGQNSAQMTISVQVGSNTATSFTMFTALASTAQNTPPTVTLTSPVANAVIYNGQAITLSVSTSGNAVSSVDYPVYGNVGYAAPVTLAPAGPLSGHTADSIQQVSALDFLNHAGGVSGALFSNDTFGIGTAQNFAARFTGQVTIPTSGRYTFYLGAASGANLLLNGASVAQVLEQNHCAEAVGSATLPAGKATIEADYAAFYRLGAILYFRQLGTENQW